MLKGVCIEIYGVSTPFEKSAGASADTSYIERYLLGERC